MNDETAEDDADQMEAGLWLHGYLRELIAERAVRGGGLISALIAAEEDGDQLTSEEGSSRPATCC
ncbi:cytochrome P450 [Mycolicibacterium aubagnense]